jgi:hypothetical protein
MCVYVVVCCVFNYVMYRVLYEVPLCNSAGLGGWLEIALHDSWRLVGSCYLLPSQLYGLPWEWPFLFLFYLYRLRVPTGLPFFALPGCAPCGEFWLEACADGPFGGSPLSLSHHVSDRNGYLSITERLLGKILCSSSRGHSMMSLIVFSCAFFYVSA